ncbi:methyltransferase-domain-containing protein [Phlyctochytrium arcticum]|nr:methyltransferase-domain-containing protein [Phlyctochytrium arcticum]
MDSKKRVLDDGGSSTTTNKKVKLDQRKKMLLKQALNKSLSVKKGNVQKKDVKKGNVTKGGVQKGSVYKAEDVQTGKEEELTPLQQKMAKKLAGSKFRWINELLYTSASADAVKLFTSKPEMFDIYHEGFRSQTEGWPVNPVDGFLEWLRGKEGSVVVADMGCGDAKIGRTLKEEGRGVTVHSFDLVKRSEEVTACDIRKVPLKAATVDVVIFCLSLMGTNFLEFLQEAHRILKPGGELRIAEVISRFPDVPAFLRALEEVGFTVNRTDDSNKMFILFECVKGGGGGVASGPRPSHKNSKKKNARPKQDDGAGKKTDEKGPAVLLKPCIYKRR